MGRYREPSPSSLQCAVRAARQGLSINGRPYTRFPADKTGPRHHIHSFPSSTTHHRRSARIVTLTHASPHFLRVPHTASAARRRHQPNVPRLPPTSRFQQHRVSALHDRRALEMPMLPKMPVRHVRCSLAMAAVGQALGHDIIATTPAGRGQNSRFPPPSLLLLILFSSPSRRHGRRREGEMPSCRHARLHVDLCARR